jgi:uncharacterized RDD family membrane protein YckC
MNTELHPSSKPSIQDFQSFIGSLLESENEKKIDGIRPITQGLGLESPKKQESTPASPAIQKNIPSGGGPREASRVATPKPAYRPSSELKATPATARVEASQVLSNPGPIPEAPKVMPPPLPTVPFMRRTLSFFVDQVLVGALWILGLTVTSNFFTGFETGISLSVFGTLSEPFLFRLAVIQLAVFWIGYLAIGLGVFNRTFGMWVWGIRISYGNEQDENYHLRKLMRIIWSFVFYVSVIPSLVLAYRKNNKNLIDILSGSNLYLSP